LNDHLILIIDGRWLPAPGMAVCPARTQLSMMSIASCNDVADVRADPLKPSREAAIIRAGVLTAVG
jgi:hypothetical protein